MNSKGRKQLYKANCDESSHDVTSHSLQWLVFFFCMLKTGEMLQAFSLELWRESLLLFAGMNPLSLIFLAWFLLNHNNLNMNMINNVSPDHSVSKVFPPLRLLACKRRRIIGGRPPEIRLHSQAIRLKRKTFSRARRPIGLLQQTITWYKIRHAGGQAHYYSPTGTLKQRDLNQSSWNNNELAPQHGGFCTMWLFAAKGLLMLHLAEQSYATLFTTVSFLYYLFQIDWLLNGKISCIMTCERSLLRIKAIKVKNYTCVFPDRSARCISARNK